LLRQSWDSSIVVVEYLGPWTLPLLKAVIAGRVLAACVELWVPSRHVDELVKLYRQALAVKQA
jgi:hypothetical protein